MKKRLTPAFAAAALVVAMLPGVASARPPGSVLDDPGNARFDELLAGERPPHGTLVGHTTISGPSWTEILTGVHDKTTPVIDNVFVPERYNQWPTVDNALEDLPRRDRARSNSGEPTKRRR